MSGRTLRILLAEDDSIGARFAISALERLGHAVVTVDNGRSALDLLKREHFDAALLDMGLPELSGLDVARRLRNHEKAKGEGSLVIVALTASDVDESVREAAGIDAVLEKPVDVAVLDEALERCFRARSGGSVDRAPAPVVDLSALSERANHEDEFIRELLGDFLALSESTPLEILAAVETGRHDVASAKAHRLRGALLAVGATPAAKAVGEIELHASALANAPVSEPQRAALSAVVGASLAIVEQARAEVRRFLAGSVAATAYRCVAS
jgi:CheY-like chemotaxis protein